MLRKNNKNYFFKYAYKKLYQYLHKTNRTLNNNNIEIEFYFSTILYTIVINVK